jgi:predicted nucleotidyltransferase
MNINELDYSQSNIQYHRQLNPAAWSGWRMLPRVREQLVTIAGLFIDSLDLPNFEVEDVRLTGSMCNFNWTRFSDFDLHIVTDYEALDCDDLAEELYHAKKSIWNDRHDITINGHDVELYIEDSKRPPRSQGMFSVINNQWIVRPEYIDPHYDHDAVNSKVKMAIDYLQKTIEHADSIDDFERATDKIYRMRQSGLESGGEFSTENLAFKVLRNLGWIDRVHQARADFIDKTYSL